MASRLPAEDREKFMTTLIAIRDKSPDAQKKFADLMPTTIEGCLDQPIIRVLQLVPGVKEAEQLEAYIESRLIRLIAQVNVAHNMNDPQLVFTTRTLLDNFSTETLADITLVLNRGAAGYYGSTYHQLDCSVIVGWMRIHLEEKAQLIERNHQTGKDTRTKEETAIDYKAYIERTEKERAQEREQKIAKVEAKAELAEARRGGFKSSPPEKLYIMAAIQQVCARKYAGLHGGQFKSFFNHPIPLDDKGNSIAIFCASVEDGKEILAEAQTLIQLDQPTKK